MTPIDWLLSGDTGTSSKTICAVMTGSELRSTDVPHDNDDFGRCYRLLRMFPEWRARLHEVAEEFPMWGPMVEAWDELTALYEGCCEPNGQYTRASYKTNEATASKLYARMQVLIDEGRIAAGWTKTGPGCWKGPGVQVVSLGGGASLRHGR